MCAFPAPFCPIQPMPISLTNCAIFSSATGVLSWLSEMIIRAMGLCPQTVAIFCSAHFPPMPPCVQKNATRSSEARCWLKYARTGEDSRAAQTGVPTTTKSYSLGSCLGGMILLRRPKRPSIAERMRPRPVSRLKVSSMTSRSASCAAAMASAICRVWPVSE